MAGTWKVVGISFDHMHMGDLLRRVVAHPDAELVGVADTRNAETMRETCDKLELSRELIYDDYVKCIEQTAPDLAVLCPSTATHGSWTQAVAAHGINILVEKPFAASLAEADAMTRAVEAQGKRLAINWPMAWYPPHRTTKRLIDEGTIGDVIEVHYYDGNRGPVMHKMDKEEVTGQELLEAKKHSWFYKKDEGGGSLLDYLGYGVTLGTWFNGGKKPIDVTTTTFAPEGLEVDEHSITVARYDTGLSKFETRWGTFRDPWTGQPQPKCGFVVVGSAGTISSYDFESTVRVQTNDQPEGRDVPVDSLQAPFEGPIQYMLDCLEKDRPIEGPLSPAVARIGQQIVDTAVASAEQGKTLPLIDR